MHLLMRTWSTILVLLLSGATRKSRRRASLHLPGAGVAVAILVFVTTGCQTTPVQLALWPPVQVFPEETDVYGLRVDLLYGSNEQVYGADVGLGNQTLDRMVGFQAGALFNNDEGAAVGFQLGGVFNQVGGDFTGFQLGGGNKAEGKVNGLQLSYGHIFPFGISRAGELHGGQLASGWNSAEDTARGFQVALFLNVADQMSGLQMGVINKTSREGDEWSLRGAQVGWVNQTRAFKGVQLGLFFNEASRGGDEGSLQSVQVGLVNYAPSLKGVQLGLLNFNRDGFLPFFPFINIGF